MTHPLTKEMIQSIWDKVGNDIVDAKDEELGGGFVEDDLMRTAYDKGSNAMLDRVIEWIRENLPDGYYGLVNDDEVISDLKKAMRPQEDTP